jgi:hypothetical protein
MRARPSAVRPLRAYCSTSQNEQMRNGYSSPLMPSSTVAVRYRRTKPCSSMSSASMRATVASMRGSS